MGRVDPQGSVVMELRADTELVTLAGGESQITGTEARSDGRTVVVQYLASSVWPLGSPRSPLREFRYAIRCKVPKGRDADIVAKAMAERVSVVVHNLGWRTRTFQDDTMLSMAQSQEESTVGVVVDPQTGDPTVTVLASYITAARAA